MGLRGKKSSNVCSMELTVRKRPDPPKRLSKVARAMWKQIVGSLPVEHFRRSELPLLEKYCMAEGLYWKALELMDESMVITTAKGYSLPDTYLTIANKQVQLQTALATKLRIATNARISKDKAGAEKETPKSKRKGLMFGEGE